LNSIFADYSGYWLIPFVGDDVVAKWVSNEKDKAALDTQKRRKFRPEMRQNAFGGHPLGELDRSPNLLARMQFGGKGAYF